MTATSAKSARPDSDAVKHALAAHASCSDVVVTALQDLLGAGVKTSATQDKENVKPRATSRPRSKTKAQADADVHNDAHGSLTPRAKFLLATEVVNISLKTLSDALKPQPKSHSRVTSTAKQTQRTRTTSSASVSSSASQRPTATKALSQLSQEQAKSTSLSRSSSYTSTKSGTAPGIVAVAECARLAFAYLRTSEAWKTSGKDMPALQLETGMLSLVGKLLSHNLEGLAAKELRILKRRLETYLRPQADNAGASGRDMSTKKSGDQTEKETLASLLNFEEVDKDSSALQLALNHQIYVLKIIASSKRAATIESAFEFLQESHPSSPVNILQHLASRPANRDKASRQMETVAQMLLSLCPSISSSEDSTACNSTASPSPNAAFQLQSLAFEVRSKWWKLSGHQGDAQKELLGPFSKCLVAFSRRSETTPSEKYSLVVEKLQNLERSVGTQFRDRNICTILSSLAQAAGLGEEAINWMRDHGSSSDNNHMSGAARAASQVRIATLSFDNKSSSRQTKDLATNIESALESLDGSLKGDSSDLASLLTEVSGLRRAASKTFVDAKNDPKLREKCFAVVAACTHFLARYIGTAPADGADAQVFIRHGERLQIASKAVKGFLESATACCKTFISSDSITWDLLDSILRDCHFILCQVESIYEAGSAQLQQFSTNLQRPFVKISGLYWLFFAQLRKKTPSDQNILRPLRKSVEVLLDRTEEEKTSGLLLLKLEKLGEVLEEMRRYGDASEAFSSSLRTQIDSGVLQESADKASWEPIQQVMQEGRPGNFLRTANSLHRMLLRTAQEGGSRPLFLDQESLNRAERSVLLEVQLILCCETYAKSRKSNTALNNAIRDILQLLLVLFTASDHPLRRQRVATHVLRLGVDCQDILGHDLFSAVSACSITADQSLGSDAGLSQYRDHYVASHSLSVTLLASIPSADELQGPLRSWQEILDTADAWSKIATRIDAFDVWISQLQMVSDFLGMKGLDFVRVPVLSVMAKALDLQQPPNPGKLVQTLSSLGAQHARLGYSGKAGTVLAKAQDIIESGDVPTEAVLQWHLAYAEYMLVLGNLEKCGETLSAARSLAENDDAVLAMTKPTASYSTRLRYNKLLSEASHVYSLLSLSSGYPSEALAYAKQCVNLNRKIWLTVENRKPKGDAQQPTNSEMGMEDVTDGVSKLSVQPNSTPVALSMTHGALTGAAFWSFVPSIFRGLSQLSSVFAHQGMLQEAIYFAEQASRVAAAVNADPLVVQNFSSMARYYLESNRLDDASDHLAKADSFAKQLPSSIDLALYHTTGAQLRHLLDEDDEALQSYDKAHSIVQQLSHPLFIQSVEKLSSEESEITQKMSDLRIEAPTRSRKAPAKATKTKKTTKTTTKTATRKPAATAALATPVSIDTECRPLEGIQATILCRKASLLLARDRLSEAVALIESAAQMNLGQEAAVHHQSTRFRSLMSEAMREIAADFTFNALPESTISFPALSRGDRKLSEASQARPSYLSIIQTPSPVAPVKKGAKGRKATKEDFAALLQKARDCIAEVQSQAVHTSSTSAVQRVCSMLNEVTILLSATNPKGVKGSLHPLYAAYLTELPKTNASQLEQLAIAIEHQPVNREDLLTWPNLSDDQQKPAQLTAVEFQTDYVNIIPQGWTAVSLALNEAKDELYITRYVSNQSPFILRLPMARHNSRDMDEEIFGFEEGKAELQEVIELSNFSTRNTPDLSKKGAKTEWWAEREALDARLGDLLTNIENIWLGGFRGIFKKKGDKALLSRFQKSFENILDRHLPSRQGKGKQCKKTHLDSRILELFVGLGNPDDEGIDLDEPLMDLVYFVVDILQFNGERNAYDEIDFDSIIIEMLDALRSFHEAADSECAPQQHTILILDKNLHAFPWESLPSLKSLSISRLPSMSALRERLLAARAPRSVDLDAEHVGTNEGGHHIPRSSLTGMSILNPGGDLKRTQETLEPHLRTTPGAWQHLIGRTPEETTIEASLASKDVLLYFGHGSGAQYIRGRTVKKLHCQTHPNARDSSADSDDDESAATETKTLAASLLFGCSSAHVTDNGAFEPSGMLCAYLTAGVPAVLGMLWDVTDKDCDRFAVATLTHWGLFEGERQDEKVGRTPVKSKAAGKTPSKSRSRSRAKAGGGGGGERLRERKKGLVGLDEAVAKSRDACYLKYLNGAAAVVYGIPVFLDP